MQFQNKKKAGCLVNQRYHVYISCIYIMLDLLFHIYGQVYLVLFSAAKSLCQVGNNVRRASDICNSLFLFIKMYIYVETKIKQTDRQHFHYHQ